MFGRFGVHLRSRNWDSSSLGKISKCHNKEFGNAINKLKRILQTHRSEGAISTDFRILHIFYLKIKCTSKRIKKLKNEEIYKKTLKYMIARKNHRSILASAPFQF